MRLSFSDPGQQPTLGVATREAVWAQEAVISPPSSRLEQMNKIFGYLIFGYLKGRREEGNALDLI